MGPLSRVFYGCGLLRCKKSNLYWRIIPVMYVRLPSLYKFQGNWALWARPTEETLNAPSPHPLSFYKNRIETLITSRSRRLGITLVSEFVGVYGSCFVVGKRESGSGDEYEMLQVVPISESFTVELNSLWGAWHIHLLSHTLHYVQLLCKYPLGKN